MAWNNTPAKLSPGQLNKLFHCISFHLCPFFLSLLQGACPATLAIVDPVNFRGVDLNIYLQKIFFLLQLSLCYLTLKSLCYLTSTFSYCGYYEQDMELEVYFKRFSDNADKSIRFWHSKILYIKQHQMPQSHGWDALVLSNKINSNTKFPFNNCCDMDKPYGFSMWSFLDLETADWQFLVKYLSWGIPCWWSHKFMLILNQRKCPETAYCQMLRLFQCLCEVKCIGESDNGSQLIFIGWGLEMGTTETTLTSGWLALCHLELAALPDPGQVFHLPDCLL